MPQLTYASYLDLEKLLTLQQPRSTPPEHDEMLFIIIHQTYELWFKQLLHEFEKIKNDFSAGDLFGAIHSFKRVRTIMKVLVAQIDILETMTPASFSSAESPGLVGPHDLTAKNEACARTLRHRAPPSATTPSYSVRRPGGLVST